MPATHGGELWLQSNRPPAHLNRLVRLKATVNFQRHGELGLTVSFKM